MMSYSCDLAHVQPDARSCALALGEEGALWQFDARNLDRLQAHRI